MRKQQSFVTGAVILTVTSLIVRMVGFLFRIYLSNAVGAEGMGIYALILSVHGLCVTVATSSLSVAVSRLVAEQLSLGSPANAKRVLRRSVNLSILLGCVVGALLFTLAEPIASGMLGDGRTLLSLRILAPGLPFIAVSSCLRGYFIAYRRTGNPASGQLIEQFFKIAFIVLLLPTWIPLGLEYACALIVLGLTLGEIVCFLYSLAGYLLMKKRDTLKQKATMTGVLRQILEIILPVSVASYIRSALRLVENVLTMNGLRTYSGGDAATSIYGMVKGMALPLLLFPLNLLSSFVITLTPEISRMNVSGQKKRLEATVGRILQYTCYAGVLIVCVFMTFSRELGICVYNDAEVGEMLYLISFLSPFMCLEMVVVGILQGLGEQISSTKYNVADCFLRIGLVCLLVPTHGVGGFLWMMVASNLFTSILNIHRLVRVTSVGFQIRNWILKPAIAAAAAGQITRAMLQYGFFSPLPMRVSLFVGIALACGAYVALLVLLDCVRPGDMQWLWSRFRGSSKQPKHPVLDTCD